MMDHSPEMLRQSDNLFALVLEVARRDLEIRKKDDQQRLDSKLELVRQLFRQGVPKQKVRHLLDFIDHYLQFEKSDFLHKFEEQIQQITKSRKAMGIREAILHEVEENGIKKGVQEKELIFVTRGWKRGMPPEEIADLADMTVEKVKAIIRELEGEE